MPEKKKTVVQSSRPRCFKLFAYSSQFHVILFNLFIHPFHCPRAHIINLCLGFGVESFVSSAPLLIWIDVTINVKIFPLPIAGI